MTRRTYELRVVVESDDPEPALDVEVDGGTFRARLRGGGRVVSAASFLIPTAEEKEAALDAVVALLDEREVGAVEVEIDLNVPRGREAVVRGAWVKREYGDRAQFDTFRVRTRGFYGRSLTRRDAAELVLREEQRRKLGAG